MVQQSDPIMPAGLLIERDRSDEYSIGEQQESAHGLTLHQR